jgi:PPOX class probable F420-dependent enzyme
MENQTTVPDELVDLLTTNILGHVSAVTPSGRIATNVMWVDYDGEHVLTSSPMGSRKGRNWRQNPQASVSVLDRENPWRWVEVSGRVTEIHPDEGLAFINKMSQRYTGRPYSRPGDREVFVITPDRVRAAGGRR